MLGRDKGSLTPWSFKPPDSDKLQKGSWLKLVHSSSRTVAFNHFALFNQNLRQRLTHATETKVLWNPYVSLLHIMHSDSFCSTQLCSISFEKRVWLTKLIAQSEVWKTSLQNWFSNVSMHQTHLKAFWNSLLRPPLESLIDVWGGARECAFLPNSQVLLLAQDLTWISHPPRTFY